jgi:cell division septation protein DedD
MRIVRSSWIRVAVSVVVTAIAGTAAPASAQPTEAVWEASSGLTPEQVCPAWTLTDTAPGADPVLAGGALTLATAAASEDMLYVQTDLTTPLPDPIVVEARVRVDAGTSNADNRGPAAIAITTAENTGMLLFVGTDEVFLTAPGDVRGESSSVDGAFHTYHVEVTAAGAVTVLVDGTPTLTGSTYTSASAFGSVPRILWGEGSILAFGTEEWESFRHNAATCGSGTTTTEVPTTTTTSTTEESTSTTETPSTSSTSEPPSSTTVAPTTSSTTTVIVPTTSSTSSPPPTSSSSTSLPPASTTSTMTTPHTTTTTSTLPGGCDDVSPGSLDAVRCRLGILAARIADENGLGKLQSKLASTLERATGLADEAKTACDGGDTKTASRRMKQIQKLLQNMAHRLRGLAARKHVDAGLRADLLAIIDGVRSDAGALRRNPCQ